MADPIDPRFERDRVTSGDYRLVDFDAQRRKLDSLLKEPDRTWQAGFHPTEDLAG